MEYVEPDGTGYKTCPRCKEEQKVEEFYWKTRKLPSGVTKKYRYTYCKSCAKQQRKDQRKADPEKDNAMRLKWKKANPERTRELNKKSRKKMAKIEKKKLLDAYGGKCECCGETDPHFLTLEHKNGVPDHHKINGRRKSHVYKLVEQEGYPDDYCLLCYNCNMAKGNYGFCPHDKGNNELYFDW